MFIKQEERCAEVNPSLNASLVLSDFLNDKGVCGSHGPI